MELVRAERGSGRLARVRLALGLERCERKTEKRGEEYKKKTKDVTIRDPPHSRGAALVEKNKIRRARPLLSATYLHGGQALLQVLLHGGQIPGLSNIVHGDATLEDSNLQGECDRSKSHTKTARPGRTPTSRKVAHITGKTCSHWSHLLANEPLQRSHFVLVLRMVLCVLN
jgi:hypothetical protein